MVKRLNRKKVASNSKFNLYFDHLIDDHFEVEDFLSVEPKVVLDDLITGILVLPINSEGKLGLINVYRHVVESNSWEVVKGFVEEGEDSAQAGLRELLEETGCKTDINHMEKLTGIAAETGVVRGKNQAFLAHNCELDHDSKIDELGFNKFKFFSREEVVAMIENGEIFDAGSLGCLCHYFIK